MSITLGPLGAVAGEPVRVAVALFPVAQAHPFRDVVPPRTLPLTALYDTLTRMTSDGVLVPQLAREWQAEDPHTWIFQLRTDATFSSGRPVTAAAVADVLKILLEPGAESYSIIRDLGALKAAKARDTHTLEVTTHYPDLMLPRVLSGLRIPDPQVWREQGAVDFSRQPVGSGAFVVEEWTANRILLQPRQGSWRSAHSAIEVLLIPDEASRLQALLSGAVDVAVGVGPDDATLVASQGGTTHVEIAARVITLAFVTVRDSPLQDPRVRRALNFAVNRELIVQAVLGGATVPASQAIPRKAFGYDPGLQPYDYDPGKARALLAEAGFADGFALTATVAVGSGAADEAFYQAIAQDLRRVGVQLTLQRIGIAKLVQHIYEGAWPGEAFGMDYGTEPSLDGLRPFLLHSCLWSKPWHCDPQQVPVIEAARREFDPGERRRLVRQLVRRHHADPPGIMLFELPRFDGLGRGVRGYAAGPGWIDLADLELIGF